MSHRFAHARRNPIPYLLLAMAIVLAVGGGYALAASKVKTITVCADKKTGVLHLKTHGKCKRGQTRVTWNQRGPQGPQGVAGAQGPAGQPGAPAINAWANVANDGSVVFGRGIAVQHVGAGTYQVTITAPACAQGSNAPTVSVSDSSGPAGGAAGAFPVAWYGSTSLNQQFMVFTGDVVGGSFSASDHTFTVMDTCM
jgi:hypothetical protein